MDATSSTEKGEESDVCNAFPYLSYLRSHLKEFLQTDLSAYPLEYSFYVKNVLPPYRSRLSEASAPTTSFCYLEKYFQDCTGKEAGESCPIVKDVAVCLPNSDTSTEGKCVSCRNSHLQTAIQNGALKDEARIRHLNATCEPKSRGPNPVPQRNTNEARWLRWFLESSFVFEGQKAGDNCSAWPGLSKARYHLDLLMKAHFGEKKDGGISLTTPGKETKEEETAYEGVRRELKDKKNFYEDKLGGIEAEKQLFWEVYCSREEGLVCMGGKCVKCGDEGMEEDGELMEVCGLKKGGGGGGGKGGGAPPSDESSGAQGGGQLSSELAAAVVGIVVSTLLGNFRW
jgi:hypothetical protein